MNCWIGEYSIKKNEVRNSLGGESMDALKFVVKTLAIGAVLVVLMGCGLVSLLTYQKFTPAPVVEKVSVSAPAAVEKEVVAKPASVTDSEAKGSAEEGIEKVCKYSEGFDANGKVVSSGTTVHGPALIKPDRNRDHAILLLPGSNYVTSATDEVIWTLIGDSACVLSQGQFFSTTEVQ